MELLYTVLVPACLLYPPNSLLTSCLLVYLLSLLFYCFTTCTDLLQLLGVWYSPSQLLFTCLPVFQLCALTPSLVLSHLFVVVGSEEYF